jgi:hypothetical protein
VVNARAVGSFRLRLHLRADATDWLPEPGETTLLDGALALTIERAGAAVPALSLALVLIDPIGREAEPLMVDAVPV